jgi:WW domain-binding protein 11
LLIENHYSLFVVAEADGALDKARKHKKRQLEDSLNLVMKKRKVTTHTCLFC